MWLRYYRCLRVFVPSIKFSVFIKTIYSLFASEPFASDNVLTLNERREYVRHTTKATNAVGESFVIRAVNCERQVLMERKYWSLLIMLINEFNELK